MFFLFFVHPLYCIPFSNMALEAILGPVHVLCLNWWAVPTVKTVHDSPRFVNFPSLTPTSLHIHTGSQRDTPLCWYIPRSEPASGGYTGTAASRGVDNRVQGCVGMCG